MDWQRDLPSWPLKEHSVRIRSGPHLWHAQIMGTGPDILLLHGAGGATQSWRKLMPLLSRYGRIIAVDLPGQGFTRLGARNRCSMTAMRDDLFELCQSQAWSPKIIIGHSAGGALGLSLNGLLEPEFVICINPALGRFEGVAGWLFPALAKIVAATPFFPSAFAAFTGNEGQITRLLQSTGSDFDDDTVRLYTRLAADRAHVNGTLQMMAQWDISPALEVLNNLETPTLFLVGSDDGTVPPEVSERASQHAPAITVSRFDDAGHLLHEENPIAVRDAVVAFCNLGALSPRGQSA